MQINEFSEMVLIHMNRQNKTWKYLASVIGKSPTYTKQVVNGFQNGKAAKKYRQKIAEDLNIFIAWEE